MLISRGNLKLGVLPSFSLPVIKTCPGKTAFCEKYCYGLKGNFALKGVIDANERRLDASYSPSFVPIVNHEIKLSKTPAFRLHVVGDFYSVEYTEKWTEIASRLPEVMFFGSTRSWRVAKLAQAVKYFRDMGNVYLKASIDLTADLPPPDSGWNVWSVEGEGLPCPHDKGKVKNCYICGRCWKNKDIDTKFELRWGRAGEYTSRAFLPERR